MNKSLAQLLADQLGKDFVVWDLPHAARALILKNVTEDLQVGLMVDKGRLRGAWIERADMGVRIPSVEEFYDRYEIHAMRHMAFADPEPTGWLTFWRPTYSSHELEERGLKVDAIQEDFAELYDAIAKDPVAFRAQTLDLLCEARRPDWATEPGSTFTGNFYDDDGSSVEISVLPTVLMPLLSYRYETSQKGDAAAPLMSAEDQKALQRVLKEGARVRTAVQPTFELRRGLSLQVGRPASGSIGVDAAKLRAAVDTEPARTIVTVRGVAQPPTGDVFVRVFVNKPDAGPQTPTDDPHYAGSFAFFSGPQMPGMGPADFLVDATETVRRLTAMGRMDDRGTVNIKLVAVPQPGRAVRIPAIQLEGIGLAISPIGRMDQ